MDVGDDDMHVRPVTWLGIYEVFSAFFLARRYAI